MDSVSEYAGGIADSVGGEEAMIESIVMYLVVFLAGVVLGMLVARDML